MYRAPEMVDPYLGYTVDKRSDIWMLGCVLYTLAYFTHPFVDSNAVGIAEGVLRFPAYPNETKYKVSPKMQDLIRHILTPNPRFRPDIERILRILDTWDEIGEIPLNS